MKRARPTKWIIEINDIQEMPVRTEEFQTESEALVRYAELESKAKAEFDAGRWPAENPVKPEGRY
jgi:hypothetical protein